MSRHSLRTARQRNLPLSDDEILIVAGMGLALTREEYMRYERLSRDIRRETEGAATPRRLN